MDDLPFCLPSPAWNSGRNCRNSNVVAHRSGTRPGGVGAEPSRAAALLKSHKGAAAKLIMAFVDELGAACLAVTLQIAL